MSMDGFAYIITSYNWHHGLLKWLECWVASFERRGFESARNVIYICMLRFNFLDATILYILTLNILNLPFLPFIYIKCIITEYNLKAWA